MQMKGLYEEWLGGKEIMHKLDLHHVESIDDFMEANLEMIKELLDKDDAEGALAELMQLASFLNVTAGKEPSIIGRLRRWLKALKNATERIVQQMGADSYSISVGLPVGVSIGVSFPA
jgi:hypothetical protein